MTLKYHIFCTSLEMVGSEKASLKMQVVRTLVESFLRLGKVSWMGWASVGDLYYTKSIEN